jgi:hypothetical protein
MLLTSLRKTNHRITGGVFDTEKQRRMTLSKACY